MLCSSIFVDDVMFLVHNSLEARTFYTICFLGFLQVLHTHTHPFYGLLEFVRDYPGELVPEAIWFLLKQETVAGNSISWA